MADDTEDQQDTETPVADQEQEQPVQQTLTPPTAPPSLVANPQPIPQGVPMVPFRVGARDPVTGQVTYTTGYGKQATPPDQTAQFWNRLRQKTYNLPLAQTDAAVTAALRFQGQRQYQQDLQKGMSQEEAFKRAAPLMFSAPRQSSLGQAAQFMRAMTPKTTPARVRDVGGVLYRENPDGSWTPLTKPKAVAPKPNPYDAEDYRAASKQIEEINKLIAEEPATSRRADELRNQAQFFRNQQAEIRRRGQTASPTRTGTNRNEVVRFTRQGRKAVFDSTSRKFIRYAD